MAVKDRTKPIRTATTKDAAKYLGPQTLLGLTRHLVQVSCEGVLITAWLTDEDFEKGFENVPEPESRPRVDPTKPIRLQREAWTDHALLMAEKVKCVQCIPGYRYFVRIEWMDGRIREEWWKEDMFQESFENVPEESPVASVTVDGEKLAGATSADFPFDNGAAPEPHASNGKAAPEIDWEGEVECRLKGSGRWVPLQIVHRSEEFDGQIYGVVGGNQRPIVCYDIHWQFRNKPKPEPIPDEKRWEAAMDGRPVDCQRKTQTLWQVWVQYPPSRKGIKFPFVVHTCPSRIAAIGFLTDLRNGGAFPPGCRFVVAGCKAPVMPEPAEYSPGA